ncbi:MAG: DUF6320 domain-containing protein [Clostridia bacterium]|nr:DUF6320 domain-containing protein [Clostridia bacterium]MDD4386159.1 DUF6320 domain-containing protein [Clostridia bacterium]
MKICKNCKVKVISNNKGCPLCKTVLTPSDEKVIEDIYPIIKTNFKKYNMLTRIFLFLSILGAIVTIIINYATYNGLLWSVISIAFILYFWSIISHAIKHNINIAYKFLVQTICISLLTIIIDYIMGYTGWAVNYVVPELIITANIAVLILIIVNRMNWYNYVLYQMAIVILGFIPLILFFLGIIHEPWSTTISVVVSLMILCGTMIFSDKNVKNELKRRLHF